MFAPPLDWGENINSRVAISNTRKGASKTPVGGLLEAGRGASVIVPAFHWRTTWLTTCGIGGAVAQRLAQDGFAVTVHYAGNPARPNVYGMGLFADGGIFATKPYLCGSNYILKMSDYGKPRAGETDWCEIMDGLYWRFIDRHRAFFEGQARLNRTVALLDRMDTRRRARIFAAAEQFIARVTTS